MLQVVDRANLCKAPSKPLDAQLLLRLFSTVQAMRILALHGSSQTSTLFEQRLGPLIKRLGARQHQITCIDAPHALPLRDGQEASLGWWREDVPR